MKLYEQLAADYEQIFPSLQEKVDFIEGYLNSRYPQKLLDLGCATGELVLQLSSKDRNVTGIDLDPHMIAQGVKKATTLRKGQIQFYQADMEKYLLETDKETFHLITCLGNTLVYLGDESALSDFLLSARMALSPNGVMIVQVLNYQNPKIGSGFKFLLLETENLRFERDYIALEGSRCLGFRTSLMDKKQKREVQDLHWHFPFESNRIQEIALDVGFQEAQRFGNYQGKKAEEEDFFHLIVLKK